MKRKRKEKETKNYGCILLEFGKSAVSNCKRLKSDRLNGKSKRETETRRGWKERKGERYC